MRLGMCEYFHNVFFFLLIFVVQRKEKNPFLFPVKIIISLCFGPKRIQSRPSAFIRISGEAHIYNGAKSYTALTHIHTQCTHTLLYIIRVYINIYTTQTHISHDTCTHSDYVWSTTSTLCPVGVGRTVYSYVIIFKRESYNMHGCNFFRNRFFPEFLCFYVV